MNLGTLTTAGDDQATIQAFADALGVKAGAFLQQLPLVVIYSEPACLLDKVGQFITVEHRHTLARVKDKRDRGLGKLGRVRQHAIAAVGGNNAYLAVLRLADVIHV